MAAHDLIVLVGTERPVSFFGYAGVPSVLTHESQRVESLFADGVDPAAALEALAHALQAPQQGAGRRLPRDSTMPTGALTPPALAALIAAALPNDAIVVDEGITLSPSLYAGLATAREHDYLSCKGGSIGLGLPAATGAALAAPGRRVIAVVGDGSAAYTLQALWTQAREGLDVTTVVVANEQYAILQLELLRSGAPADGTAQALTTLSPPALDRVSLAPCRRHRARRGGLPPPDHR